MGRAADSRRITQARSRRLRTHGVALPARTAEETVTDLAHISRESPRPVDTSSKGATSRDFGLGAWVGDRTTEEYWRGTALPGQYLCSAET